MRDAPLLSDGALTTGAGTPLAAHVRRRAVRCLASNARDVTELIDWLGALGLNAQEGK